MTHDQDNSSLGDMAGEMTGQTKRDDGGPAFAAHAISEHSGYVFQNGMTLRQWYAATYRFEGHGPSIGKVEAVMNEPCPDWSDPMAAVLWWAEAEAKLRFIYADAMIKEGEE